jgi:hypothetical protein
MAASTYTEKVASDDIEVLDSWTEMSKVLAILRATSMDAGAYLLVGRKLKEATRAVYAEGVDDGFHLAQEDK